MALFYTTLQKKKKTDMILIKEYEVPYMTTKKKYRNVQRVDRMHASKTILYWVEGFCLDSDVNLTWSCDLFPYWPKVSVRWLYHWSPSPLLGRFRNPKIQMGGGKKAQRIKHSSIKSDDLYLISWSPSKTDTENLLSNPKAVLWLPYTHSLWLEGIDSAALPEHWGEEGGESMTLPNQGHLLQRMNCGQ